MSLAHGRPYLAIPGPSVMPDAVLQAMHQPAPNIYEGDIVTLVEGIVPDLKRVAKTEGEVAIYIANGHGAWEAALSNLFQPGDRVLIPATGRFAHGWADMAVGLGIVPQIIEFGTKSPIDAARIEEILAADTAHEIKAVMFSHVDTASSIRNDPRPLRAALDAVGHPALLMADCIASMACDEFHMDAWGVDVAITGSQKGLMVPPGLSFVFFNDRAKELRAANPRVSRYWDWVPRTEAQAVYQYFGGTSPTHHLFGLRAALDMLHGEGMEQVWARHATLARVVWAACERWSEAGALTLNIAERGLRSHAVTALGLGVGNGQKLRRWTADNAGLTLGLGLGMATAEDPEGTGFFRIGHMGHLNAHMVLGAVGVIEAGLQALQIPHGKGALEKAAEVVAQPGAVAF